jgi:hypothetical protein
VVRGDTGFDATALGCERDGSLGTAAFHACYWLSASLNVLVALTRRLDLLRDVAQRLSPVSPQHFIY